jgi:predicted ester cyclase
MLRRENAMAITAVARAIARALMNQAAIGVGLLARVGGSDRSPAGTPTEPTVPAASETMAGSANDELVQAWLDLWNGDESKADAIVSDDFSVHVALMAGAEESSIRGSAALLAWIGQARAATPDLRFAIQVGPIARGEHVVVRWIAQGTYGGGFPGATAPAGTPVSYTGTDILRVENGRIAEYWLNADVHVLLAQLQVTGG